MQQRSCLQLERSNEIYGGAAEREEEYYAPKLTSFLPRCTHPFNLDHPNGDITHLTDILRSCGHRLCRGGGLKGGEAVL